MRLRCQKCRVETPEELYFCLNCRTSLFAKSDYDLTVSDFIYGPDLDGIRTISATGPLPYILKNLALGDLEKTMIPRISTAAQKVTNPSELDAIIRNCAVRLSLEYLPEVFILDSDEPNAFTLGSTEHAYMFLDSTLLRLLTELELAAVIAHELGHIKSGHMLYHTLAEVLGGGLSLSASLIGLNLISIPIRFALLSWQRESEVTADRTSLLAVNDIDVMRTLLTKLASGHGTVLDERGTQSHMLESAGELLRTHPLVSKRFKLAKEFWQSEEFLKTEQKIQLRERLLRRMIPMCRFCGESKLAQDLFCPRCGKCQT